ncbi:uncharacterized protein YbaP (TraB family) [Variovorax sp. W1I1]|uniref:TraB/GumN family protein n=1 Tax=Variovorax sp. W1I1 TaxID=3042309 RepID=UPI0027862F4E|nr:TraB/GumN family protein [Variovorax sp. W1I1]MDQ0607979.1 uncharacterized protein YbaP (TraB family) [Variovorax sp. W1I1]
MYYDIAGTNTRILGAIHVFPAGTSAVPSWVWDAFHWSELIEKEHDSAELIACFHDAHTKALKPWGALFMKLGQGFRSIAVLPGVEVLFANALAATSRPAMTYLETGKSVGDLFDAVPASSIAAAHTVMDAAMAQMEANLCALHSAWNKGDAGALEAIQRESPLGSMPSMRHAFFSARNENWAHTIAARGPSDKRRLLVVGALHLVGPDSLLQTLTRCGLDTHPVPG